MILRLSIIATAILTINLAMTFAGDVVADGIKPTAAEIKAAFTGFSKERTNSRGVSITHTFLADGILKYQNARGHTREGKWWVVGDSPAPTYNNKDIAALNGTDPAMCYDFPRAGKGDIRRICTNMEKVGDTIKVFSPTNGKLAYTVKIKM